MVNQQQFDIGLDKLRTDLTLLINESIKSIQDTIITNLVNSNKMLQEKVEVLEDKVVSLEAELHANNQYTRQNNLLISGIPEEVEHENLEKIAINIINKCNSELVVAETDVQGCHRISKKNKDVVCRITNKKYIEGTLYNRGKMKNLKDEDKTSLGLPSSTVAIYLNEHLSPYNAKLAFYCRRLRKNNLINNMSTKKGVIKIEGYFGPNNEMKWRSVGHLNDLHKWFPDLEDKIAHPQVTHDTA